MEQEDIRPKWLQELENRKRKPRLAHEAGAGSPCLICNSACPGLDLHFWRKICKNCKCDRDDHDVNDNEFPQFDLLFGPSGKSKNRSFLLRVKKQNQDETPFEWIPPNTSKELAADYMKALPDNKLPIKGSAGAALRRQQLQKQLPLHDIDHEACDQLSDQERTQFQEYLQNLRNYVGQGKVIKSLGARPFSKSLMTPANATDVQQFSPQRKAEISRPGVNLRTPSSFISKNPTSTFQSSCPSTEPPPLPLSEESILHDILLNAEPVRPYTLYSTIEPLPRPPLPQLSATFLKSVSSKLESMLSQSLETTVECSTEDESRLALANLMNHLYLTASEPLDDINPQKSQVLSPPSKRDSEPDTKARIEATGSIDSFIAKSGQHPQDLAERMLSEALLPPSAVHANDIIGSTLDEKGLMYIKEKLNSMNNHKEDLEQPGPFKAKELERNKKSEFPNKEIEKLVKSKQEFATCKSDSTASSQKPEEIVTCGNRLLNIFKFTDEEVASLDVDYSMDAILQGLCGYGSVPTSVVNSEQLHIPIFPEEAVVGKPRNPEVDQLADELENTDIVQKKQNCHKCHEEVNVGDVVVTAEKAKNEVWHPGCFVCSVCNELLADLVYFFYKGQLYCGRDLATHLNIQRCFACDELIFTSSYTVAEGHTYHVKHFCCWDCDEPLAGKQYTSENDRPLCLPCYQKVYAKICAACNQAIAADQQGVAIKNLDFHVDEKCFCCFTCKTSLLNGKIGIKEDKPFCSKECITQFQNQKT